MTTGKMIICRMPNGGQPSTRADSSTSYGTPSMAVLRIHTATGIANAVLTSTRPPRSLSRPSAANSASPSVVAAFSIQ